MRGIMIIMKVEKQLQILLLFQELLHCCRRPGTVYTLMIMILTAQRRFRREDGDAVADDISLQRSLTDTAAAASEAIT